MWCASGEGFGAAAVDPVGDEPPLTSSIPGERLDAETGHYNRYRHFDPSSGRYVNADPIGQSGGVNVYAYAFNDPVGDFDPYGLNNFGGPVFSTNPKAPLYKPGLRTIFHDAHQEANTRFPDEGIPEDKESRPKSDFRHCFASCEAARHHGSLPAWAAGEWNEYKHGQSCEENERDRAANEYGRAVAEGAESREDCVQGCQAAARVGVADAPQSRGP